MSTEREGLLDKYRFFVLIFLKNNLRVVGGGDGGSV